MTLPVLGDLRELLSYLSVKPQYVVSMESLQFIQDQDPAEPLPDIFEETIVNLRRVVYASKDFHQTGLYEYNLGLLYMEGQRFTDAAGLFEKARNQWSFIGEKPYDCLAHFTEGVSWHYAYEYEEAAVSYLKAQQCIEEIEQNPGLYGGGGSAGALQEFLQLVKHHLKEVTTPLQDSMRRAHRARLLPVIVVEPPVVAYDLADQDPQPKPGGSYIFYFDYSGSLFVKDFRKTIYPALEAIRRVNDILARANGMDPGEGIIIEGITHSRPLEITLSGLMPQTPEFCRHLFEDVRYRDDYEQQTANLERVRRELERLRTKYGLGLDEAPAQQRGNELGSEIGQIETKINELHMQQATKLVDLTLSADFSAEERLAFAVEVVPDIRELARLITNSKLTLSIATSK